MRLDQPRVLSRGTDLTVLSSGLCTEEAMKAVVALKAKGVSVEHLHLSTLKPCDHPSILEALAKPKHGVITIENHLINGGLGTIAAEKIADNGLGVKLHRLGLKDTFAHGASRGYLMREYGLDALSLVQEAAKALKTDLKIKPEDLAQVRVEAVHSEAKPEAL
jgi:transketolase